MDGGIIENSVAVVIGKAGAGKTTFALQYIMRGMDVGDDGVFITLDENQDQILREAREMGFTQIDDYIKAGKLVFIDASAEQFSSFIRKELPSFVEEWGGTKSRIVIDPLTPVIWATPDKYMQREIISFLFKELRKVGTVVSTLEEHGPGDLSGPETIIPMYLADSVIHLQNTSDTDKIHRNLQIVKCRSSRHSERKHEYKIMSGIGISIQHRKPHIEPKKDLVNQVVERFREDVKKLPRTTRGRLLKGFKKLQDTDFETVDPEILINDILEEYR
jgi:KaiC/GvpD/RAD55 family RecA-like ATPase